MNQKRKKKTDLVRTEDDNIANKIHIQVDTHLEYIIFDLGV